LANVYADWAAIGGFDNLMSFGEFPLGPNEPEELFLPRGIIFDRNLSVAPVDIEKISEHVAHSWYQGATAQHPRNGETAPNYTGFDTSDRYSWLKAPRYGGHPVEVGPLARVMVAYASGHSEILQLTNDFMGSAGLSVNGMFSTLGRTAARAIETQVIAEAMPGLLDLLQRNIQQGDKQVFETYTAGTSCTGVGLNEAPRGALGHWVDISNTVLANYQMVVPSTWNFGPRCLENKPGPVEQALVNTPVQDAARPLEILRVLHSFDPCIACGVHVLDPNKTEVCRVRVL
jgi:[NiFe] hydrogenase large subunit